MLKKFKPKIEFRYYRMPAGCPVIALLGDKREEIYGRANDSLHFHNYLEIGYCYSGDGTITLGETDHPFSGEEFTIIPQNYPHSTNCDPDTHCHWEYLLIDTESLLRELYSSSAEARLIEQLLYRINSQALFKTCADSPKTAAIIRRCLDIMRQTDEYYIVEIKSAVATLLINIAREGKKKEHMTEEGQKISLPISIALDYISLHYMEPLQIKDLADCCHISETHFRRIFSQYMHISPLEYIHMIRIQTACDYLKKTDESVAAIAHKCGFSTLSTFNRNFQKVMGSPPSEWRKKPEHFEQQLLRFRVHTEQGR